MGRRGVLSFCITFAVALVLVGIVPDAGAQTTTTSIRGLVRDPSGAAVPGADLKLVDTATQIERTTKSNLEGSYIFANLPSGTYNLTATAQGFQTAVYNSVVVDTGRNTDLNVQMTIGATTETVEVVATAVQLETTSNTIGTTVTQSNIQNLPYASRDSLGFARLSAGAAGGGGATTFNNLPNASLNISLDGINNNSQRFRSGGTSFYTFAPARVDAVEQVTISTTGLGAEAGGEGAMQIKFVTKRGTDRYKFRVLNQFHNEYLNANSYFNTLRGIERPKTRQNYFLGSVGGPLAPFIPYLKNKLFFFAYYEHQPDPRASTRSTVFLTPEAQQGIFRYIGTDGVQHAVDLLQLAGNAGFRSTIDPTVKRMLDEYNATKSGATGWEPDPANLWRETMLWRHSYENTYMYPTARVDYQITPSINWHGTWNMRRQSTPRGESFPVYPGTPGAGPDLTRTYIASNHVDWTISPTVLNNVVFGIQSNRENFYTESSIYQWASDGHRRINLPLTPEKIVNQLPWNRNNPVYELTDTLTMVKGKHTATFGGKLHYTSFYEQSWGNAGVLNYALGVNSRDPVYNVIRNGLPMVSTTNSDRSNALNLYAQLTGRLTGITGSQNVDEKTHTYERFAPLMQRFAITTGAVYAQDSWRIRPNFTLNFGLRMQFDGVIHNTNGIDTWPTPGSLYGPSNGPFQPGVLNGFSDVKLVITKYPYKGDFLNPSPNIGFSWNPQVSEDGFLGKLLGGNRTVIGASYNVNFYNEGLNAISNLLCCNGGTTQSIRAQAPNQFDYGTLFLDSPLPQFAITPAEFRQEIPASEYVLNGGTSYAYANPNLRSPYVQNWNFRIQRELARGLVVEARYVGNRSLHMWRYQDVQEINIIENGFLAEFLKARQNLAVNRTQGVESFENRGLAGQVPLPIFETIFGPNGSNGALSSSTTWRNSSYLQQLDFGEAGGLASTLSNTSNPDFFCRLVGNKFPGCVERGFTGSTPYPINFFKPNPYLSGAGIQDNNGNNNYHGLQIEVRKALSYGLTLNANYTWSKALGDMRNQSNQTAQVQLPTLRNRRVDYGPSPFDRRHALRLYWEYQLPFGRGRWLSPDHWLLDRIVANWTLSGIQEIVTGGPSFFTGGRETFNQWADGGVVFGGGLTPEGLIKRLETPISGYNPSCQCFLTDVQEFRMANGAVDPKYFRPGDTPGVIGPRVWYYGKTSYGLDLALSKEIRITERVGMGFKLAADDFLNHPFLSRGSSTITGNTFGNLTSASGERRMYLRSYIDF